MCPAKRAVKENGQLMITEIYYGTRFMNSYLDITYPTVAVFFSGSKVMGDPIAVGDDANLSV